MSKYLWLKIFFVIMVFLNPLIILGQSKIIRGQMSTDKIIHVLEEYRKSRPTINDWLAEKKSETVVETSWFRDHKGEVVLKISIDTAQNPPEIQVFQKVGWLLFFSKNKTDTEWAVKTKQGIIDMLNKAEQ